MSVDARVKELGLELPPALAGAEADVQVGIVHFGSANVYRVVV